MSRWTAADIPDQSGRTVLVTGANSGLGLRTAEALTGKGAHVLLGCRDAIRAEAARSDVAAAATGPAPEVVPLDLADLGSVRDAAQAVAAAVERLDVLVNNAGVMAMPQRRTADGFELQFGTNHLGHFALTGLLLPVLLRAEGPRVVTVSSNLHRMGASTGPTPTGSTAGTPSGRPTVSRSWPTCCSPATLLAGPTRRVRPWSPSRRTPATPPPTSWRRAPAPRATAWSAT